MGEVAWIPAGAPPDAFPSVSCALARPDGLLAVGGDLTPERLLYAYRHGIFPWYSEGQPILWWSPSRRSVLWPRDLKVSRSLGKRLRRREFTVRLDSAFDAVVAGCAAPRRDAPDTWITREMHLAYRALHRRGYARSVETWREGELVGGLYGVALGGVFFGESMFSRRTDASKVAMVHLCRLGFELIDCQLPNDHLARMGATSMPRRRFVEHLDRWCEVAPPIAKDAMH